MRKKWLVPVISILLIAAVLIGAKVWHVYETTEVIEEKTVQMSAFDEEAIVRIEIRDDTTHKYKKVENVWVNETYPSLQYDQEKLQSLTKELSHLVADRSIRKVQDLSNYGIHEYARLITVYDEAGNTQNIAIGSYTSEYEGYYVWTDNMKELGILPQSMVNMMISHTGTWIQQEIMFPTLEAIEKLTVKGQEEILLETTKVDGMWTMQKPYVNDYPVQEEALQSYYSELMGLQKEKFVAYEEGSMAKYGLEQPAFSVSINDENFLTVSSSQEGMSYMRYKEEPFIYQIETAKLKKVQQPKAFDLLSGSIAVPKVEDLKTIELKEQDRITSLNLEETLTETQEAFVQQVTSLKVHAPLAQASLETSNPREAELTLVYTTKDGRVRTLEFIPYDPSFYLLRDEGIVAFSVEKKQLIECIKLIKEGIQ